MSSQNLSLAERGSIDSSYVGLYNKETQTSTLYITDSFALLKGPSRPLPKGIDKSKVEPALNILDFKVIKDPSESKTPDVVKKTSDKNINNSDVSINKNDASSRLKYCKEIVVPYLKANFDDCEQNIDSLERLIQDALEELPDYQPCFEVYDGTNDIQEKVSRTLTADMKSSQTTNMDESSTKSRSTSDTSSKKSGNNSPPTLLKSVSPDSTQTPENTASKTIDNEKIAQNINEESIMKCVQGGLTALKCSASNYREKFEVAIGIKKSENPDEKPTYYSIERPTVPNAPPQNAQTETGNSLSSLIDLFNNNNAALTTVKETVLDIAEKFYKTSKDAVTLISSESAKLLSKGKIDIFNTDNENENQPKLKEVNMQNTGASSFAKFLFKNTENEPTKNDTSANEAVNPQTKKPVLTASAIKSEIVKITEQIVESKIDRSSPYDKVISTEGSNKVTDPPNTSFTTANANNVHESSQSRLPTVSAVEHVPQPQGSSMFTIIKSKIFSIFRDNNENTAAAAAEEQRAVQNEEEEDPFERFMEN